MSMIIVKNTKTGQERPMTQKSFDYLSSKNRGFTFVRNVEAPKTDVQLHMDRLRSEKAAKAQEPIAPIEKPDVSHETLKVPAKRGPKPKTEVQ